MLEVLEFLPKKGWLCKCDCGKERYIEGNHLRNFKYMSCGCDSRNRQSAKLKETLRLRQEMVKKEPPKVFRFPTNGVRCWVCRNKTGRQEPVSLCRVCRGDV